jgi:hypothetical protein
MSWFTAIVFGNIASVREIGRVCWGAKGLRLWNIRGARSSGWRTYLPTKQEKGRKIETAHRKFKWGFEPKIREVLFGMSLLEQAPRFAANKHPIPMNSQWHHVLRRPSLQVLQVLRRLKFTKQLFRKAKWMYKNIQTSLRVCMVRIKTSNPWRPPSENYHRAQKLDHCCRPHRCCCCCRPNPLRPNC